MSIAVIGLMSTIVLISIYCSLVMCLLYSFYMSTTVGGPVSTVVWAFVYYTFCFVSTAFFFVYAYCGRQSYLLQF